ncbi:pseudouridine synthase [Corticibacter populi]|uniref:Pseudouridine synthase n=1 Tax=Corticibacter populi TaxID=1550736 RepID=A0A3M6QY16_9BURK|nr:pseudouridine synthase [Corticibacter populi]RMX07811.1 pseudouridine synthase [Corticibacter populi]RZS35042.1 ribosomal large subunit pseudouridine synthase B [Corticibacter populi]
MQEENKPAASAPGSAADVPSTESQAPEPKAGPRLRRGPAALRNRLAGRQPGKAGGQRGGDDVPPEGRPSGRAAGSRPGRPGKPSTDDAAIESSEGYDFEEVVAGALDVDAEPAAQVEPREPHKRVLQPDAEQPKLHKLLAQAGIGSRLEMEALIQQGKVSVNDAPAHVGQRVQYGDQIKINGKPVRVRIAPPPVRVLAYHKVAGEMVTRDDPQNRPTVFRKLPYLQQGKWQAVGRLDINTEGLLLLTNSGDLANRLMHPRYGLEREYAVRVLGALSEEEKARLLDGVMLEDGEAAFSSIQDGGGEGVNQWYRVTISEGRNREVRRMMEVVGHAVSRLIRIRYGSVVLMRGLRRGMWLDLSERDVARLMGEAEMPPPPVATRPGQRPARGGAAPAAGTRGAATPPRKGGPAPSAPAAAGRAGKPRGSQPDPLQTSMGYIGQDGFTRKRKGAGNAGRGRNAGPGRGSGGQPGRGGRR